MSGQSRRAFLKRAAGAVPGAAIAGPLAAGACASDERVDDSQMAVLPEAQLRAVAEVALPTGALGADGTREAVGGFLRWVEGFEPAAELDHPYLTGELRYGPPNPGPRWKAQLEAMDLEARRRSGVAFTELPAEGRRRFVGAAIEAEGSASLPSSPARARHVVVGLLAWFYGTSRANDLCYGSAIGRHDCRGIGSLPDEPPALDDR
jgi:hypothetical protein